MHLILWSPSAFLLETKGLQDEKRMYNYCKVAIKSPPHTSLESHGQGQCGWGWRRRAVSSTFNFNFMNYDGSDRKISSKGHTTPKMGRRLSGKRLLWTRLRGKNTPMCKYQESFLSFSFSFLLKGFSSFPVSSEEIAVKNYFTALKMKTFAY